MSLHDFVVCSGEVTLAGGTATVLNSNIQARDVPIITCSKAVGAAYVSAPSYSGVTTAGQLDINALSLANPAALVASDVSLVAYTVLRPVSCYKSS
jgi:hypothetical protein